MRRSTTTKVIVSAMTAGLLLAACGNGDSDGNGADTGTDTGGDTDTNGDAGGGDAELTEATITLNWVPYGEHAPFYYGIEQGIFEDAGIDLTVQPGNGSGNTVQQVAQQNTDFGWVDTPPLLNGISSGMPVKSVGVFLQTGPSSVEFFADQNISEPADLVGKTVGGTPGDAMYGTFPAWLEINGVDPADVDVVNVDAAGKVSALIEGQVDAIQGFYHDQAPTIAHETGRDVEALPFAEFDMNLLGLGLIVNDAMISDDPELVQAMVDATAEAFLAAQEDPDAAAEAMAAGADQAPPAEVMAGQLETTLELLNLDEAEGPGVNTTAQWEDTIAFLAEYTDFDGDTAVENYWDNSFTGGGR